MRITPKTVIGGLGIAGALVSQCPAAHADGYTSYVTDLASYGVPQGSLQSELTAGAAVCHAVATGMSTYTAVDRLMTIPTMTRTVAATIVVLSVMDLCPQYDSMLPQSSTPSPAVSPIAPSPGPVTIAGAIRSAIA